MIIQKTYCSIGSPNFTPTLGQPPALLKKCFTRGKLLAVTIIFTHNAAVKSFIMHGLTEFKKHIFHKRGATTLSIMIIGLTPVSLTTLNMTIEICNIQHKDAQHNNRYSYAKCHLYHESCSYIVTPSVIMPRVIMLEVAVLNVVAPTEKESQSLVSIKSLVYYQQGFSTLGQALGLTCKHYTRLQKLARDSVNYAQFSQTYSQISEEALFLGPML